jgi:hypothetical protein
MGPDSTTRLQRARLLLVIPAALVLGGCFLMPGSPSRPPLDSISGPVVYVEGCESCHAGPVITQYAGSLHAAKGIRCGQCHPGGTHPDFTEPVRDAKCGGCHLPELQQTLASKHFSTRVTSALDGDRTARAALRQHGFMVAGAGGRRFAGDATSGDLGGRLCVACHYDEHGFALRAVRREDFCVSCHAGRESHYAGPGEESPNRCTSCHVREGQTVSGRIVNTHRFAIPGADGTGR